MNDMNRLESVSRALFDAFKAASPGTKRAAVRGACEVAVQNASIVTSETDAALVALRDGARLPDPVLGRRLQELAAQLDEQYFELGESPSEADRRRALALFSRARAVAALAYATSAAIDELHEAIYEATATTDDPASLVERLRSILQ